MAVVASHLLRTPRRATVWKRGGGCACCSVGGAAWPPLPYFSAARVGWRCVVRVAVVAAELEDLATAHQEERGEGSEQAMARGISIPHRNEAAPMLKMALVSPTEA